MKRKLFYRYLLYVIFLGTFTGCEKSILEDALKYSGDNRYELEKVLSYYSKPGTDPLKLRAARFLIENMLGHYSYNGDDILRFYHEADSVLSLFPKENLKQRPFLELLCNDFESIAFKYPDLTSNIIEDILIIKADYLIENIDAAFDLWRNRPWAMHLSFEEFSEYILPYKVEELQQLDYWRDTLKGRFNNNYFAEPYNDEYRNSVFGIALSINQEIKDKIKPFSTFSRFNYSGYKLLNAETIYKLPFGECGDYSILAVSVLRSEGIPASLDYNLQWGRKGSRHLWSVLHNNFGKSIPFHGALDLDPGEVFYPVGFMSKAYRKTYSINKEVSRHNREAAFLKNYFSVFSKDVTREYMLTSDISISLNKKVKDKYVYLANFDNKNWTVVDFGKINGKKGVFTNVGRDIVYVILGYNGKGLVPVSYPFLLKSNGEISYLRADNETTQTMRITRKHPISKYLAGMQNRIIGGQIQASDDRGFSEYETLYTIDSLLFPDKVNLPNSKPYRYWRYYSPPKSYCTIAELQFFRDDSADPLVGAIIGTEGSHDNNSARKMKERAFDGDWLTYSQSDEETGAWIGMDFGVPTSIRKVRCVPRFDDNGIRAGDRYQLKVWQEGRWKILKDTIPEDKIIYFKDIPVGGLYLLSNLTRGIEERFFTYEKDRQIFW